VRGGRTATLNLRQRNVCQRLARGLRPFSALPRGVGFLAGVTVRRGRTATLDLRQRNVCQRLPRGGESFSEAVYQITSKRASGVSDARLFMNAQIHLLSLRTVKTQCAGTGRIIALSHADGRRFPAARQIGICRAGNAPPLCHQYTIIVLPSHCGCRSARKGNMRRLCRGLLPLKAEIQAILRNRSRPARQPRDQLAKEQRGSGGKRASLPPGGFAPRGSMTLRRAKAALYYMISLLSEQRANPQNDKSQFAVR